MRNTRAVVDILEEAHPRILEAQGAAGFARVRDQVAEMFRTGAALQCQLVLTQDDGTRDVCWIVSSVYGGPQAAAEYPRGGDQNPWRARD